MKPCEWLPIVASFVAGILAFALVQAIDSLNVVAVLKAAPDLLPVYALAGLAFALCAAPALRVALARAVPGAFVASTFAFAVFLVPALWVNQQLSARWLIGFYALALAFDWLVSKFVSSTLPGNQARKSNASPRSLLALSYVPFILAGLFLLALVPVGLLTDHGDPANRLANWSFGMLALGAVGALLNHIPIPVRVINRVSISALRAAVVLLVVAVAAFVLAQTGVTKAESTFITDLNQNYLGGRVGTSDLVISSSPALGLGNVPRLFPSLDVRPDQRGAALWDDLSRALQGKHRVFWVSVPENSGDNQGYLAAFLKANGCLDDIAETSLPVRVYEMRTPLSRPTVLPPALAQNAPDAFDPVQLDFGAIQLTGTRVQAQACSHDAVAVALKFQADTPTAEPLSLSLTLMDAHHRQLSVHDWAIQDASGASTNQWKPHALVLGYYLLPVPLGTTPGDYVIAAGVYPSGNPRRLRLKNPGRASVYADLVAIGETQVYRPNDLKADPFKTAADSGLLPAGVALGDGIKLDAYAVSTLAPVPGSDLFVTNRWRATQNHPAAYTVQVQVVRDNRVIARVSGSPVDNTYPTDRWLANEPVLDRWQLPIPADAPGGPARLEIALEGGKAFYAADIEIAQIDHGFQVPSTAARVSAGFAGVGDLVGYELDGTQISTKTPLGITLYWRAGSGKIALDYSVFAQLIAADGHLIAQSDGAPGGGQRPTRGWLSGEYIQDRHELAFGDAAYQGDATLIVGLYDPSTGDRVALTGSSRNSFEIPVRLVISGR